jgi:putative DNA primase/helicase
MLVLEGDQGIGKTRACRILGGDWFGSKLPNLNSDYAGMYLQGKWIIEVGELSAIRGVTRERAKDFITQTVDSYKRPYDREITERPRQCVFVATTNSQQYLDDIENRRYWPIRCGDIDREGLANNRDQLFAEAVARYKRGEKWFPDSKQSLALKELQDNRVIGDAWENRLASFLFTRRERFVSGDELLHQVGLEPQHMNRSHSMRVADVCRRLGWHATRAMVLGTRKRGYIYHGDTND